MTQQQTYQQVARDTHTHTHTCLFVFYQNHYHVAFVHLLRRLQPSRFLSLCTRLFRLRLSWGFVEVYPSLSPKRCSTLFPPSGTATSICHGLSTGPINLLHFSHIICFMYVALPFRFLVFLSLILLPGCVLFPFQVPGVHAPQPVSAQPHGAVRRSPSQGALLCFPWHAALRHGQDTVRLPLSADEWQPAARL